MVVAGRKRLVVCNGPWLVVQLRQHCITLFHRDWKDYNDGFGSLQTDLWLGLEAMHQITTKQPHKARFHMIADNDLAYMAEYSSFKVDDEATNYRLSVSGHSGNASDDISTGDGSTARISNGRPFSTPDWDNDASSGMNCAERYYSSWWQNSCSAVDFNAPCKNQLGYKYQRNCLMWDSVNKKGEPFNYTRIEIMPNR